MLPPLQLKSKPIASWSIFVNLTRNRGKVSRLGRRRPSILTTRDDTSVETDGGDPDPELSDHPSGEPLLHQ